MAPAVAPPALLGRCHRHRQTICEPDRVGQIRQQSGPGMAHHVLTVGAHLQPRTGPITLHLGSALLVGTTTASTTAVSLARRALPRIRAPHTSPATERGGLGGGSSPSYGRGPGLQSPASRR